MLLGDLCRWPFSLAFSQPFSGLVLKINVTRAQAVKQNQLETLYACIHALNTENWHM